MSSKKIYTLRGQVDFDGAGSQERLLFNYESNKLDQGWIVKEAHIWYGMRTRATVNPGMPTAYTGIKMQLQSDTLGLLSSDNFTATDNRAFGWYWRGYTLNDGLGNITPNDEQYVLDPDHLIARQLWATFSNESGVNMEGYPVIINYLIVLEKVKTTPAENILQQVKSVAQDILN